MTSTVRNVLRLACAVCVLTAAAAPRAAQAGSRWELLEAIHWVENPSNSPKPGRFGELGPYQFRELTWRAYTKKPFSLALDRAQADKVAVAHYEWLRRGLEAAGVPATPYNIALAWNSGLSAVVNGRAPGAAHDYAARVTNIAAHLARAQVAGQ